MGHPLCCLCLLGQKLLLAAFVVPTLRKVREGMGHPLCWLCLLGQKPLLAAFVVPTLRKVREGWGTPCVGYAY
jgi:hypothetical protein